MTHREIRELEDGTRVYADYHRYRPLSPEERTYAVRKPDDPRAVRFHGQWFLPLDVLDDDARTMPVTRPDTDAYDHMPMPCRCDVCKRPEAGRWQRRWLRDNGLRPPPVGKKTSGES